MVKNKEKSNKVETKPKTKKNNKVEKTDNDKKIQKYQREKWILICMCLGVIILEVLALFNVIDVLWGCGLFLAMCILKKFF